MLALSTVSLITLEVASHLYETFFLRADSYDLRHNINFQFEQNLWRYKPNINVIAREKTGNISYQTNDMGFRLINKDSADSNKHSKVIFIGDSVAFGLCSNQSAPQLLQARKDTNYDFTSMALPGYNPKDYYYNYLHIKNKAKYTSLFIMLYMNDLTDPSIVDQATGNVSKEKEISLPEKISKIPEIILSFSALKRTVEQLARTTHFYGIRPIARSSGDWTYKKVRQPEETLESLNKDQAKENMNYLSKLIQEAKKNEHKIYAIYSPHEASIWTERYQIIGEHMLNFAASKGASTINLEPKLRSLPSKTKKRLYCDGLHFTDLGNEIVSQLISKEIKASH